MRTLFLHPASDDRMGRPVFISPSGHVFVDVDYQANPRKEILTKYPAFDAYYGEPDCHLADDVETVFTDMDPARLVCAANDILGQRGNALRFRLVDGRFFIQHDVETGDDFDELSREAAVSQMFDIINRS